MRSCLYLKELRQKCSHFTVNFTNKKYCSTLLFLSVSCLIFFLTQSLSHVKSDLKNTHFFNVDIATIDAKKRNTAEETVEDIQDFTRNIIPEPIAPSLKDEPTMWPNFIVYTRQNNITGYHANAYTMKDSNFDFSTKTYLIIHGYLSSHNETWISLIKNNLLLKENANVIVVDWKEGAMTLLTKNTFSSEHFQDYLKAAQNTKIVGNVTANFLIQANINSKKVHCIGHSLGAHACGFIGKHMKLNRITGLDPAGVKFMGKSLTRLNKDDADFVDVIHTCALFGLQMSMGHQDFWPNGGNVQPLCIFSIKMPIVCSHKRVTLLYAESILSRNKFRTSLACNSSYELWEQGKACVCTQDCPRMGHYSNEDYSNVYGNFYLKTFGLSPFSIS